MFYLILSLITILILFVLLGFSKDYTGKVNTWKINPKQFLALIGAFWMIFGMVATVPTGHTGILTTFGKVEDRTLESGLHVKSPFQKVVCMDNRTQVARVELSCFSSDIQEVLISYSMNYQIEKSNAQTIYKTIGVSYYETVMQPRIQEVVKSVIAKYTAESLVDSRDALSKQITDTLVSELGKYNIEVISTSVENIDFSDAFTDSVEAKVVAQQALLKAQTEQQQKTMEQEQLAARAKIAAEADASVAVIQATADKEVLQIQANAAEYAGKKDAAVNDAISRSLTDILIEYYKIKQWNGELPEYFVSGTDTVLPILGQAAAGSGSEAAPAAP